MRVLFYYDSYNFNDYNLSKCTKFNPKVAFTTYYLILNTYYFLFNEVISYGQLSD